MKNLVISKILILCLVLTILPLVNAQYDWDSYGNVLQSQSQLTGSTGRFDVAILNLSLSTHGMEYFEGSTTNHTIFPYQPLVAFNGQDGFIAMQNNTYLVILGQTLNVRATIDTGEAISSWNILDFDNDGRKDIAGFYQYNSSMGSLKVYDFNNNSDILTQTYEQNFTFSQPDLHVAGLRHTGSSLYFVYDYPAKFTIVNLTSTTSYPLQNQLGNVSVWIEPPIRVDIEQDGSTSYLVFNRKNLLVFNETGGSIYNYSSGGTSIRRINNVQVVDTNPSALDTLGIAILEGDTGGTTAILRVRFINNTEAWSKTYTLSALHSERMAVDSDYNGDGVQDIYVSLFDNQFTTLYKNFQTFEVLSSNNGTLLSGFKSQNRSWQVASPDNFRDVNTLVIADMNNNSHKDFIFNFGNFLTIYDPYSNTTLLNISQVGMKATSLGIPSCTPADINHDGFLELICAGGNVTYLYYSNATNINAQINSVNYLPSIIIANGTTLNAIVSASDFEGDGILYSHTCSDYLSFTTEDSINNRTCTYLSVGEFNLTLRVRDVYHLTYNSVVQLIIVNASVIIPTGNESFFQIEGGTAIPLQIVNIQDSNQGLLPEIYFGLEALFLYVLPAVIPIMVVISLVGIIFAIATIIKKVVDK